MKMASFEILVPLYLCVMLSTCVSEQTLSWSSDVENSNLQRMMLIANGSRLIISGRDIIYNINASNMNHFNRDITGPFNATTHDYVSVMIYNDTIHSRQPVITTCSSTHAYCDIRDISDISMSLHHLRPPIRHGGVVAVMATYEITRGRRRTDKYLFVACPHLFKDERLLDDRCSKPGIAWYLNSRNHKSDTWYGFKTYERTPVRTEKYIDAFVVDDFRIFFSLQKVVQSNQMRSRVAQICQYHNGHAYTTMYTYADMPLECGNLKILQTVTIIQFQEKHVFVAVFMNTTNSAVCVYSFDEVKSKFVSNIKKCYRGELERENYFYFQSGEPCSDAITDEEIYNEPDDYFLCNKDGFASKHSVVGNEPLRHEPILLYDKQVTAVTVTVVDSKVVAFLGTTNGDVLKAVVYPNTSAVKVKQPRQNKMSYGVIQKDMYTSQDQQHIFVLTQTQVMKIPVEDCASFKDCEDCLGSKDPYCGWEYLNKRCSTKRNSIDSDWISASGTDRCPHVVSITPDVMSDTEVFQLEIKLSRPLHGVDVSCIFSIDDMDAFRSNVSAHLSESGTMVTCRPTSDLFIIDIKGSGPVIISIATNVSDTPAFQTQFLLYRCSSFDSCITCTARNWSCNWCTYSSKCIPDDRKCKNQNETIGYGVCPTITSYAIVPDDNSVRDSSSVVYLLQDKEYTINVTGQNLPEPREDMVGYRCKIDVSTTHKLVFETHYDGEGTFSCFISKDELGTIENLDSLERRLQITWGDKDSLVAGKTLPVIIYHCNRLVKPVSNCGQCQSFARYKPYLHCHWCDTGCVNSETACNGSSVCGNPEITSVNPLSAFRNASTRIEVLGWNLGSSFNDTIGAITIAGIQCDSIESAYDPGVRIECTLLPSYRDMEGAVVVTLSDNTTGRFSELFHFRSPVVTSINPILGPKSGGTRITLYGEYLDIGTEKNVLIGSKICRMMKDEPKSNGSYDIIEKETTSLVCETTSCNECGDEDHLEVKVTFDDTSVTVLENVTYTYVIDPNVTSVHPKKSFQSGGRMLTIVGTNLFSIQKPRMYVVIGETQTVSHLCERDDPREVIYCPSPAYLGTDTRRKRSVSGVTAVQAVQARFGFEMDGVSSVRAENLPSTLGVLLYFPDPTLENFTEVKIYKELQEHLFIKGERLNVAATEEDVEIQIGCQQCNITSMTNSAIICTPPTHKPMCPKAKSDSIIVQVNIGFLQRDVGILEYEESSQYTDTNGVTKNEYIVAGSVVGFLLFCLLATFIVVFVMWKKKKTMKKEKAGLEYKMDKLEAKFRNQCREEFAALQTAVSDLTSDLEGGNVLFREYDIYASKTLASNKTNSLMAPLTTATEQSQQALDIFKGLLRNTQFLLMLVRTLEKQNSFTIHDKSKVATALMVLNHDNMEYVTGILTTLLNELIDKNVATGTPKLLLRRSESVAEKLLTHWLSICLYHFLKERSGSALYILYKAIKIQTEKGPIDYISNCGKYTLSEDKLFTSADTELKPVVLTLEVKHFDYIDNVEKNISIQVLDCDSITQAKNKMLEILYKNTPYSQRPAVHSTSLEIVEGDGGTKRLLSDEDASSVKEGLWKRINTLQHYSIPDRAKVNLYLDREMEASCYNLAGTSPDAYIVGSVRRSKPVVRTISGSNFWHLTKKHQTDEDEVQLGSDLFLPRLLNTKGTLQTYIDDLFQAVLSVGDEPPLIVKYLFDFLDNAATRCNITDPDVLHTWKCNSLLLRFWVNIIKNPEFVFDIQKPLLVDSCLSVVAQTLMDSCSTADLVLGPSSPSNKLLFAKDIPRYKIMVHQYFKDMKQKPAVSDQELNSYLTQKVSQKFSGKFYQSAAVMDIYEYANRYKDKICNVMDNLEAESPGSFSPLTSKLQFVFMSMDMYDK